MSKAEIGAYEMAVRGADFGREVLHIFALFDQSKQDLDVGDFAEQSIALCRDYYLTPCYGEAGPVTKDYVERRPGESVEDFEGRVRMEAARFGRRICPSVARLYESLPWSRRLSSTYYLSVVFDFGF